ncbi:MAG: tRNA (adenosine(37)-N6)-dimethylallyltransferase MiaA [Coxiellaceae bacterium]|nr:tRNA (adenosine(37)-N6)-dimethylallyltransferase MiaA [Coxiellaceae bacterium]
MSLKTIAIMGPTASGKTDLAIQLADALPADIISVDSALVYRGMDIGTAKPSNALLSVAPHRLINLCDPSETYSAGQFCVDAAREIQAISAEKRLPLLVGGTMLYFRELFHGIADLPKADLVIRAALEKKAEKIGWLALHEELKRVDPVAAEKIKPQDSQRIQRALEVFLITGNPISVLQKNKTPLLPEENVTQIALIPEDRAWLHARIALRFEAMLAEGFIDEVKTLKDRGDLHKNMPSMRVVGYRQAWEYLEGECDFETMKARAIAATRQLAKRQLTWLRSWKNASVFDPRDPKLFEKVLSYSR